MREIKFRVWNNNRKMFIIDGMTPKEIQDDATQSMELPMMTSEDCVWQQYTGLKDKNGVEIYEGDVVERRRERGLVDFNSENYAEIPGWNLLLYQYVPYQKEGWIYQEKEDTGELPAIEYYYGCPPDKSWEVVGNIFEGVDNK